MTTQTKKDKVVIGTLAGVAGVALAVAGLTSAIAIDAKYQVETCQEAVASLDETTDGSLGEIVNLANAATDAVLATGNFDVYAMEQAAGDIDEIAVRVDDLETDYTDIQATVEECGR